MSEEPKTVEGVDPWALNAELVAVLKDARLAIMAYMPISTPIDIGLLLYRLEAAINKAEGRAP